MITSESEQLEQRVQKAENTLHEVARFTQATEKLFASLTASLSELEKRVERLERAVKPKLVSDES